jgi:fatty-acyl-CoA synthase
VTVLEGPPLSEARGVGALTLGGLLAEAAGRHADREALVFDDPLAGGRTARWTYADLDRGSDGVAAALVAAACEPGDHVGILMGNRPEAVAALFGAARVGAVAVLLSTFASPPELEWMLGHSGVSVVLTQTRLLRRDFVEDLAGVGQPGGPTVAAVGLEAERSGAVSWEAFLAAGGGVDPAVLASRRDAVAPDDPGVIIYSSGTTAHPKGMLHSQGAHALQFWLQAGVFGRDTTTRLWTALPLFWTAGLDTAMGPTLAAGGCWVMQETFEPGEALALMAREGVTEPYTLPHQTGALEEHPDWAGTDLSALRCVFGKSAFARHPTVKGDPAWIMPVGYGLSETCAQFVTHPHDTPRELSRQSMGRVLPGGRLRVVDPGTGAELGPEGQGELTVAGPTLMLHYVGKTPEECFDTEGFFHTGDAGFYDADGYVHWTGRMTEMIKTGGANVSPAEIEVQLRACPPVKLARVMGVPDARLGQMVVLCAVLKDGAEATEDDIRSFLAGRVASYKVPRRVLFFAEGEIPMTGSDNKVRDAELAELVRARMAEPSPTT